MAYMSEKKIAETTDLFPLQALCKELSISVATGRNWLKLGKIVPSDWKQGSPLFTSDYIRKLKHDIETGINPALKSRRNKKFISGNGIYKSYLSPASPNNENVAAVLSQLANAENELTDDRICLLVAECAIQLICQRESITTPASCGLLSAYLAGNLDLREYHILIDDLLSNTDRAEEFIKTNEKAFLICFQYEEKEDVLGLLYLSLKSLSSRKATGSYYTPTHIVRKLIEALPYSGDSFSGKTVLDPCCGTGNFLLQLPSDFNFLQIYGSDIDSISIKITRINMALKYHFSDVSALYEHFQESNFLMKKTNTAYDYIIGNPPWGYTFSKKEKEFLYQNFQSATGKTIESYDVFIEQGISQLSPNGILSFVLPEAILNVKSHTAIREIIQKGNFIRSLEYLGNVFDKVQCPCIILQLLHTNEPFSCVGMHIRDNSHSFVIRQERKVSADFFNFTTTDEEYNILEKILNAPHTTLKNQADFALGIVTGNNQKYISHTRTETNEIILKGSDIFRYKIRESENFITFTPRFFQQTAAPEYYRAPEKLLYRFISNQLVFAYDDRQTLSLNSCNIVIPRIEGLTMKYILAILNSRIAQFVFSRQFHSVKVLRSHIESIPIPLITLKEQQSFVALTDLLMREKEEAHLLALYNELDLKIAELFGLTRKEYSFIIDSSSNQNHFLR